MENKRKTLHDYSLVLILLAVLDVFSFFAMAIAGIVNGSISETLATVEPDLVGAVKIGLIVCFVIMALLTFSTAFVGFKGLKVSREPNADKGYITVAKIFLVLSAIAAVSFFASLFDGNSDLVDAIFSFANVVLDLVIYALFIKAANAVRADFLAGKK